MDPRHPIARTELLAFESALPRLLADHGGQYVVLKGDAILHFCDSYDGALTWGYEHFGLDAFFVKRVQAVGTTVHFTRDLP